MEIIKIYETTMHKLSFFVFVVMIIHSFRIIVITTTTTIFEIDTRKWKIQWNEMPLKKSKKKNIWKKIFKMRNVM